VSDGAADGDAIEREGIAADPARTLGLPKKREQLRTRILAESLWCVAAPTSFGP